MHAQTMHSPLFPRSTAIALNFTSAKEEAESARVCTKERVQKFPPHNKLPHVGVRELCVVSVSRAPKDVVMSARRAHTHTRTHTADAHCTRRSKPLSTYTHAFALPPPPPHTHT